MMKSDYITLPNEGETFDIVQVSASGRVRANLAVAREFPVTIVLNGQELVTLLASPRELDYLAVGYLSSEGFLQNREQIKQVLVNEEQGLVRVDTTSPIQAVPDIAFKRLITSGCGRGASFYNAADIENQKVDSQVKVTAAEIFELMLAFQHASELYAATHGVHSAALCDNLQILSFSDDIGRHNAIDRIFGRCLMQGMATTDRIILTTGRVSSEILHKTAKRSVPIIVSASAPTNLGVKIAASLGITLVAGVRGKHQMNIFTNEWRVV